VSSFLRRPIVWIAVLAVAAAGLYWFQPWKIVTDQEVSESLTTVTTRPASTPPQPATSQPATSQPAASQPAAPQSSAPPPPQEPTVTRQGEFVSHEHDTSGTARVVRATDGSHRLELVGLDTSNGPDLRVWLSDQPVRTGTAGWRVFDDGEWLELGKLKGNRGDQSYKIPPGTDLERLTSISIWCKRFAVSFGAATLAA